jgi:hypothetical protein
VFVVIPNHYGGWYMIKAMLYGLYQFVSIELPWLAAIVLADVILLYACVAWMKEQNASTVERKLAYLAGIMFVTFLIPNMLTVTAGRHTALSSIGFTILCMASIGYAQRYWRTVSVSACLLLLIASQGNTWSQVVACRINNAVYETISRQKADIVRSERVLVDAWSFAKRIAYTWGNQQGGLYTYYGVQALAPWGLAAMVPLITGAQKAVYVSGSRPNVFGEELIFRVDDSSHSRIVAIPKEGTLIIDYERVYGDHFKNGNRALMKITPAQIRRGVGSP